MKINTFLILILAVFASQIVFAQTTLPAAANTYIKKHFPKQQVTNTKMDDGKYEVRLGSDYELEFSGNGQIREVDGNGKRIPDTTLPGPILKYIQKNYADQSVTKMEIESSGYEINLSNGTEMKFDKAGNFKKLDD